MTRLVGFSGFIKIDMDTINEDIYDEIVGSIITDIEENYPQVTITDLED